MTRVCLVIGALFSAWLDAEANGSEIVLPSEVSYVSEETCSNGDVYTTSYRVSYSSGLQSLTIKKNGRNVDPDGRLTPEIAQRIGGDFMSPPSFYCREDNVVSFVVTATPRYWARTPRVISVQIAQDSPQTFEFRDLK